MPLVSIVTVGMNHLEFIKNFFASVFSDENSGVDFEVIYVDNCSTDGSVDFIKGNYPAVKIIENNKPKGFAENNNLGAKQASGKYLAIINPDVVLKNNCLAKLEEYAENHQGWGVLAPKLLNGDGSIQYSVRSFITLKVMLSRMFTFGKDKSNSRSVSEYLQKNIDTTKVQSVDWAIGASLFLEKDFFNELGGFDESYFLYMEDEDLCLRCWQKGKQVVYVPQSEMVHIHLRTSSKLSRMTFIHLKSMLTFFWKHGVKVKRPDMTSETV
ncbi:MAG: glycosyltransferase family 2 protein [Paludibacteraceae bacterium]|nr:glycosyltransferase family 2 protein [Candidatus Physcocola equi]MCQ2234445.1 glycosyltransferase family 2 protein [Paludibacteraceae bacterium]